MVRWPVVALLLARVVSGARGQETSEKRMRELGAKVGTVLVVELARR